MTKLSSLGLREELYIQGYMLGRLGDNIVAVWNVKLFQANLYYCPDNAGLETTYGWIAKVKVPLEVDPIVWLCCFLAAKDCIADGLVANAKRLWETRPGDNLYARYL